MPLKTQPGYDTEQIENDLAALRGQVGSVGTNFHIAGVQPATFPNINVVAASLQNLATATIPAGDAAAGAVYDLEVWGGGTWSSSQQTLQLGVALGGTALTSITTTANAFPASQAIRFRAVARVACVTNGSLGTWMSLLYGEISSTGGLNGSFNTTGSTLGFTSCDTSPGSAIDTTVSQVLALQAAWGSTSGSPGIESRVSVFRKVTGE